MNNGLQEAQETAGTFNIRSYLYQCLSRWYLFVIALAGALGYAWYEVRYTVPMHSVSATILVKDEYSSWGREYFLSGLELVSARNRLVNEIGIMKSFPVMRKTLDRLDFGVSYYDVGRIKTTELYKDNPFYVSADSLSKSGLTGRKFHVRILSPEKYELGYGPAGLDEARTYRFGEEVTVGRGRFTVHLKGGRGVGKLSDKDYYFVINDLDRMAKAYQGKVGIKPAEKESSILLLSIGGTQIRKEIDFLNTLLDVYIQGGLEHNTRIAVNTMYFIDEQLSIITDSLHKVEAELMQFTVENRDLGFGKEPLSAYTELVSLENNKGLAGLEQKYYDYLRNYIEQSDDGGGLIVPSSMGITDNVLNTLVSRLLELYISKEGILFSAKGTPDNPLLEPLNRSIATTRQLLLESLSNIENKSAIRNAKLEDDIRKIEQRVEELPASQRELINIQRKYKLNNGLYTYLLQKKAEASLAKAANLPNASVLDEAGMLNVSYAGPQSSKIYLTSTIVGMLIPFALVFLLGYFNDRILEKKDIEAITEVPMIGLVSHSDRRGNLAVAGNLKSSIAEAFRAIRTNIAYMTEGSEKVTILITSSVSGEGKTFCSINLATIYAAAGKRTLLLGADLRKPKIYQDFGMDNHTGVSNFLIGKASLEQIVRKTSVAGIDLISAGPVPPNPAELIEGARMQQLFSALKERYDAILIDTPPVGLVTDAYLLMKYSDVNLFVVRHNFTRKRQLSHISEQYRSKKLSRLGIVANDVASMGYGYGTYGYGYGYGYGYYTDQEHKGRSPLIKGMLTSIFGRHS